VFIVENRATNTREIYSCGANKFGQLGREPYHERVPVGLVEIPGNITWHDGTVYNNDDNTPDEQLNTGRFTIRVEECSCVECGAYHTHFVYPIGTKQFNSNNRDASCHQIRNWRNLETVDDLVREYDNLANEVIQLQQAGESTRELREEMARQKEVLDTLNWGYKWPSVILNCGRNIHGELARGEANDVVNPLKVLMLGGTHTHSNEGVIGDRLYPDIISSGVYHTVLTTENDSVKERIIQTPSNCNLDQIWDGVSQTCVSDR